MDELIQFLTFLLFMGIWLLNAVNQAKKRRAQELEEIFEELEEEEGPSELPAPVQKTRPKDGWEEIQKRLREMLEESSDPVTPPVVEPAPPPKPEPPPVREVIRKAQVRTSTTHDRALGPGRPRPTPPRPVATPIPATRSGTGRHAGDRTLGVTPSLSRRKPDRRTPANKKRLGRFPHFHPNPVANAFVLSEVLRGPKATLPIRRGFRHNS